MRLKQFKILMPMFFITINLAQIEATKCGDLFCEGKAECKWSKEINNVACTCEEGFVANITGNIYYCYQATAKNDEEKCLKVGDKCGPEHVCNRELKCEKTIPNFVDCTASEEICLERCCHANEICMEGKCIIRQTTLNIECPFSLKCLEKCCAENEFCSKENVCVLKANMNESAVVGQCIESQKCLDKCCLANEVCDNGDTCVLKKPAIEQCPELQKCQDKCCSVNEKCENEIQCIAIETAQQQGCPQEKICLDACCQETEHCSEGKECVAKEQLNYENTVECPESQKCLDVCCAENEACSADSKCVAQALLKSDCPETRKCLDICCPSAHICSKDFRCENAFITASTESIPTTLSPSFSIYKECPLEKQCLSTCCKPEEKCSKSNTCIPINIIECIETDICGDKCCPINETCNEHHECVAFIEVITADNCPERQQCLDMCCESHEVCNESNECVARILKKELLNHDIWPPAISAMEPNFDATVHLTGLKNHEQPINCAENYFVCQNKCCHHKQTCTSTGECEDITEENVTARDCEFGQNCVENQSVTEAKDSLAYTIIGLGCLVMVLSFALFKVYAFRRSNRIVY